MEEPVPSPVSVGRYLFAALVGATALVGLLLVARPLLFTMARPLDDTNYTVVAVSQVTDGPIVRQLLLNESHGWAGELVQDDRTQFSVIVAPLTIGGFSVVNAWSPTHDCALEIGADRLRDCAGDAWTFDGVPLDATDPSLQAFPATVNNGAVAVDFTRTFDPAAR